MRRRSLGGMWWAKPHRAVVLAVLSGGGVLYAWDSWVSFVVSSFLGSLGGTITGLVPRAPRQTMAQRGLQRLVVIVARFSREGGMRFKREVRREIRDLRPKWQRPGEVWAGFPEAVARYSQTQKSHGYLVRGID